MLKVSPDTFAFLRPNYRQLSTDPAFALLAPGTRFARLVEAVAQQSEHRAAVMRAYTPAARVALLGHPAKAEQERPGPRQVELWTAHKGERTLACVAVYLPHGVDVRLLEDGDVRRTQLVGDGPQAAALAAEWLEEATRLRGADLAPRSTPGLCAPRVCRDRR